MARMARVIVLGYPHHVTQRGNRRQQTFFCQGDYTTYLGLMSEWCGRHGVEIWAYCLMPNHVHLIVVPATEAGPRLAIGEAHRRYTWRINFRQRWRGHLWQGRFASCVMDDYHLLAASRYVELNPMRAGLAPRAEDWPFSSAAAHLAGRDDALVKAAPLLEIVRDWRHFLSEPAPEDLPARLRKHESTGRPLGDEAFLTRLESAVGRNLAPKRPGRKPKGVAK